MATEPNPPPPPPPVGSPPAHVERGGPARHDLESVHSVHDEADTAELARFGYAQALARRLGGGYSSFAVGFSVISVLTGVTSTFGTGLASGGPRGLCVGWLVVAAGTMLVALPMAELASAFPTAGALYHWSALLGGIRWGWATAMLNLIGQVAVLAAIELACAQAIQQILGWGDIAAYALFAFLLVVHGVLNCRLQVRIVAWLNDFSATVHILGVTALASILVVYGRAHPAGYVLQGPSKAPEPSDAACFSRIRSLARRRGLDVHRLRRGGAPCQRRNARPAAARTRRGDRLGRRQRGGRARPHRLSHPRHS